MAWVLLVTHRDPTTAAEWVQKLDHMGHLARAFPAESPPERPSQLDAVLVDEGVSAGVVQSLRSWSAGIPLVLVERGAHPDAAMLAGLHRARGVLELGERRVGLAKRTVQGPDGLDALTDTEAALLAWLAYRKGEIVSRDELLIEVWGYSPNVRSRVVDVTMARLRAKLEDAPSSPRFLETVRGRGYRLVDARVLEPTSASRNPSPRPPTDPDLRGREDVLDRLRGWLAEREPLVTLLGPPGIGKTRVARTLAAHTPRSVWCELGAARTDQEALAIVSEALDLPPETPESSVATALAHGTRPLVVLDNAEHVQALVGRLVAEPGTHPVLVTSRLRLALPHERTLDLAPLASDAAGDLFLARARHRRAGLSLDPPTLEAIVAGCEGLPLALELAAAQVALLGGPDLVRVLEDRSLRLRDPSRRPGHRSYDEALRESWDLLTPTARQALSAIALLPGETPVSFVEPVLPDGLTVLAALQDASLLQVVHRPHGATLRLLETVRRFVVAEHPLDPSVATGLIARALRETTRIHERARGPDGWRAIRELGGLRLTITALVDLALTHGLLDDARALALCLTHRIEVHGPSAADLELLERVGDSVRVCVLRALVLIQFGFGERARFEVERAFELADSASEAAEVQFASAMVGLRLEELDTTALEASLPDQPTPVDRGRAWLALGIGARMRGELADAERHLRHGIAVATRAGIDWLRATIETIRVHLEGHRNPTVATLRSLRDLESRYQTERVWSRLSVIRALLAHRSLELDALDDAEQTLDRAIELALERGAQRDLYMLFMTRIDVILARGQADLARQALWRYEGLRGESDDSLLDGTVHGEIELAADDVDDALRILLPLTGVARVATRRHAIEMALLALLAAGRPNDAAALDLDDASNPVITSVLTALVARGRHPEAPVVLDDGDARDRFRVWRALLRGASADAQTRRGRAMVAAWNDEETAPLPQYAECTLIRAWRTRA